MTTEEDFSESELDSQGNEATSENQLEGAVEQGEVAEQKPEKKAPSQEDMLQKQINRAMQETAVNKIGRENDERFAKEIEAQHGNILGEEYIKAIQEKELTRQEFENRLKEEERLLREKLKELKQSAETTPEPTPEPSEASAETEASEEKEKSFSIKDNVLEILSQSKPTTELQTEVSTQLNTDIASIEGLSEAGKDKSALITGGLHDLDDLRDALEKRVGTTTDKDQWQEIMNSAEGSLRDLGNESEATKEAQETAESLNIKDNVLEIIGQIDKATPELQTEVSDKLNADIASIKELAKDDKSRSALISEGLRDLDKLRVTLEKKFGTSADKDKWQEIMNTAEESLRNVEKKSEVPEEPAEQTEEKEQPEVPETPPLTKDYIPEGVDEEEYELVAKKLTRGEGRQANKLKEALSKDEIRALFSLSRLTDEQRDPIMEGIKEKLPEYDLELAEELQNRLDKYELGLYFGTDVEGEKEEQEEKAKLVSEKMTRREQKQAIKIKEALGPEELRALLSLSGLTTTERAPVEANLKEKLGKNSDYDLQFVKDLEDRFSKSELAAYLGVDKLSDFATETRAEAIAKLDDEEEAKAERLIGSLSKEELSGLFKIGVSDDDSRQIIKEIKAAPKLPRYMLKFAQEIQKKLSKEELGSLFDL
ncbi:hypothetical protein KKC60_03225 [Patescibacteria group bacterium]|nr:hypothetical protein [Patescibacteria group bacterium]